MGGGRGGQPTTGRGRPVELGGQGRRRETVPKQEKKLPRGPRRRPAGRTLSECRRAPAATAPSRSDCPLFSHSFPQPWCSEEDSRRGPEEAGVDERGKKPPRPACCPAPSRASASTAQVGRRQVRLWVEFRAVVITLDRTKKLLLKLKVDRGHFIFQERPENLRMGLARDAI